MSLCHNQAGKVGGQHLIYFLHYYNTKQNIFSLLLAHLVTFAFLIKLGTHDIMKNLARLHQQQQQQQQTQQQQHQQQQVVAGARQAEKLFSLYLSTCCWCCKCCSLDQLSVRHETLVVVAGDDAQDEKDDDVY